MTTTVYVTSTQTFSGKSALCVGLLRRFRQEGLAVGYMKPVSTTVRMAGGRMIDEDAHFVKFTLNLADPVEAMAPVLLDKSRVAAVLAGERQDFAANVQAAYEKIAAGKDVVVVEGGASLREGWVVDLAPARVAALLGARSLVTVPYGDDLQVVDDLLTARLRLGDSMIGAIVNRVPAARYDFMCQEIRPYVAGRGVPVFACIPREKALLSTTVAELRDGLGGEVLAAHHAVGALVEHLMIGAMGADRAMTYFRQVPNKAVITGGDRTDIQISALETPTRCLILTGNLQPSPIVLDRAEELEIPVILTPHDTLTASEIAESFFGKSRFHQEEKVQKFDELLDRHLDFAALYSALGLAR